MFARASLTITPQSGVGGVTPSPRKLSPASAKIAYPTRVVPSTTIGRQQLGRISRTMIATDDSPRNFAASTYSRFLTDSTALRTTRPLYGAKLIPMIAITTHVDGSTTEMINKRMIRV